MDRYRVRISLPCSYEILDTKDGDNVLAVFGDLRRAKEYADYINTREKLIQLILHQISEEIDDSFKGN